MSENNPRVTGLTLPWVLTIVFMVLKLCKVINWKWIWVFAPVWISLSVALVAFILYIILKLWSSK
jgi:hypothetical protein